MEGVQYCGGIHSTLLGDTINFEEDVQYCEGQLETLWVYYLHSAYGFPLQYWTSSTVPMASFRSIDGFLCCAECPT